MPQTKEALLGILQQLDIKVADLETLTDVGADSIYYFTASGDDARTIWRKLHAQVSETGFLPILISDNSGSGDPLARMMERFDPDDPYFDPADEVIRRSGLIDPREWLKTQRQRLFSDEDFALVMGEWSENPRPFKGFVNLFTMRTRERLPSVYVALIPTPETWKIPAYFYFGNYNDCPAPEVHCALLKMWCEQYNAKIVIVTGDVMELTVKLPPTTREAALQLAEDFFVYCPDSVYQGMETLRALADGLLNGTSWYFWWD